MGQQFKFKVGQRVWYQPEVYEVKYPGYWGRITERTIDACGKVYRLRSPRKPHGFVTEDKLSPEKPDDAV